MQVLRVRNVNDAYRKGMALIAEAGVVTPSRNGRVLRMDEPVTTRYEHSQERVLFDAKRNANPFFHLLEALWMLNGQNDLKTLTQILPSFGNFSDDGDTLHGAYGHRWKQWPTWNQIDAKDPDYREGSTIDQLNVVIKMLTNDPTNRRVVISMWDPSRDLDARSKDIPCNDLIKLAIVNGALDMYVFCRSNDVVYGCYGANAVHMSFLQEYLAAMIGVPIGIYEQISADYHAYMDTPYQWDTYWPITQEHEASVRLDTFAHDAESDGWLNPYSVSVHGGQYHICPLVTTPHTFDGELRAFMRGIHPDASDTLRQETIYGVYMNEFFPRIAIPMFRAIKQVKGGSLNDAKEIMMSARHAYPYMKENDWLHAGFEWIKRLIAKRESM